MVLLINGVLQENPEFKSDYLYSNYPVLRETAMSFKDTPSREVGPDGLLYLTEREMAVTVPSDKVVTILGSEGMTTCIAIILKHTGSGATALAHFDGVNVSEAIDRMVKKVAKFSENSLQGAYEFQLIGGYSDPRNYSEDLFRQIVFAIHKQPVEINLKLCCVGELNTTYRDEVRWPILYGVAVNVKTGDIFPATFTDREPDLLLRHARNFLSGIRKVFDVYDFSSGFIQIEPFNYTPPKLLAMWLTLPDKELLQNFSTSPDVEPPYFCPTLRAMFKFIMDNPSPRSTLFQINKPRCYKRDETMRNWQLVQF